MIKLRIKSVLSIVCIFFTIQACTDSKFSKIQGVYMADKTSLKTMMQQSVGNENSFTALFLDKAVENAIIEINIINDSIIGVMTVLGESTLINSKIELINDTFKVSDDKLNLSLIPNEKGILMKPKNSEFNIQLTKSNQSQLSEQAINAIKSQKSKDKELKEFNDNLGKWQIGNYVDEFGDDTGLHYPYCLVLADHENSNVISSQIYVKTSLEDDGLYFQMYNSSMSLKESFPDREFGSMKIKFENGEIKNEKIFFSNNSIIESPDNNIPLVFNYLNENEGELKILIDLSTASDYYTDKYQFTLSKNNLKDVLENISIQNNSKNK